MLQERLCRSNVSCIDAVNANFAWGKISVSSIRLFTWLDETLNRVTLVLASHFFAAYTALTGIGSTFAFSGIVSTNAYCTLKAGTSGYESFSSIGDSGNLFGMDF